ncbi:MAG: MmgE/PrpD family protein, partial [Pseudaminobacter sp.]|nr:MmgE/PrpD family protein [Pseudaminobacter sp.]
MSSTALSFIRTFRLEDAPAPAIAQAKRCLLDLIGVAAAGSRLPASRIIRSVAHSQFGGASGFFLFDGRSASPVGVALANATTIDGFDAHDGHPLTKGHAGCGSFAGLLAFAGDGSRVAGADALAHLVVGYEVAIRAGMALHATAADYHTSGAWVSLGVAAIGARLLRLDDAATREALGIAEYNGPRSQMMRCIGHPAMIKDGSGWGAMTGASAALLAREGFTGAPAVTVEGDAVADIWADIGARWRIEEQYIKPYPVCRWAQPAMEAAAQLRQDHQFGHAGISSIAVRTFLEASRLATP